MNSSAQHFIDGFMFVINRWKSIIGDSNISAEFDLSRNEYTLGDAPELLMVVKLFGGGCSSLTWTDTTGIDAYYDDDAQFGYGKKAALEAMQTFHDGDVLALVSRFLRCRDL